MQMSGMEQQPHSTSAAVTSGSMNDDDSQQQRHQHGSGIEIAMMDDDLSNPSSSSGSSTGIGVGVAHIADMDHPSVGYHIDGSKQAGQADTSSSSASISASALPPAAAASLVSESMSTSVGHQRRKRTATGVEQDGHQKRMRVQRDNETKAADVDDGHDGDEQKDGQQSITCLSPSIPLSIAQRFHRDGLHSIFRCLTMRELNAAAQTCKSWYAASTAPSFRLGCEFKVKALHPSFHGSQLQHHVRSLRLQDGLTTSQLQQLSLHLVSVTGVEKLKVDVTVKDDHEAPSSSLQPSLTLLPPHLTSLQLHVYTNSDNFEYVRSSQQLLMSAIGSCHRLESLLIHAMHGSSISEAELDFSPLRYLTKLRSFVLCGSWVSVGLAFALRELPLLDEVSLGWEVRRDSDTYMDFLRVPCPAHDDERHPQVQPHQHPHPRSNISSIHICRAILEPDELAALARLPRLTSLHAEVCSSCCGVLPSLKLRHLGLTHPGSTLLSGVSRMSTLTRLKLFRCSLPDKIGMELMKGLPRLDTLELEYVDFSREQWDRTSVKLEWLKQSTSLRTLSFTSCRGISEDSLLVLCDTPIQTLALWRCVRLGISAEEALRHSFQRFQYVPPSAQ